MHSNPALGPCLASRLFAYGTGREVVTADRQWLVWLAKRFAVNGYRLPDLLQEIATSPAFFAVSGPRESYVDNALTATSVAATNLQLPQIPVQP